MIQTYSIVDAIYYNPSTLTSQTILNIPNTPLNFKCQFKIKSQRYAWLEVGKDANNLILFGITGANGTSLGIFVKENGNYTTTKSENVLTGNTEYSMVYEYNNGVQSITANNRTLSLTNNIIDRDYIKFNMDTAYSSFIKEILIKPL